MGKFIDRTGQRFGHLVVLERVQAGPATGGKRVVWRCRCDCGSEASVTGHELACGDTTSCGCVRRAKIASLSRSHGHTAGNSISGAYRSWQAAKSRCENPRNAKFATYGGAGISMAPEWSQSFEAFYAEMGDRPPGMSIDRLDQTKGYEPNNCQWATAAEQSKNTGRTKLHRWRATWMTVREIAHAEGLPFNSLRKRARIDNTIQKAVAHVASHRKT